jgi:hypothetical protein
MSPAVLSEARWLLVGLAIPPPYGPRSAWRASTGPTNRSLMLPYTLGQPALTGAHNRSLVSYRPTTTHSCALPSQFGTVPVVPTSAILGHGVKAILPAVARCVHALGPPRSLHQDASLFRL